MLTLAALWSTPLLNMASIDMPALDPISVS